MPNWGYSFSEEKYDVDRLAKASGRDLRIKPKPSREICAVDKAKTLKRNLCRDKWYEIRPS